MSSIGAYEAKTKFSELLARVAKGERVTITKHGEPIAEIVPIKRHDAETARAAMERVRAYTKDIDIGDMTWEDIKKLQDEDRP